MDFLHFSLKKAMYISLTYSHSLKTRSNIQVAPPQIWNSMVWYDLKNTTKKSMIIMDYNFVLASFLSMLHAYCKFHKWQHVLVVHYVFWGDLASLLFVSLLELCTILTLYFTKSCVRCYDTRIC